MKILPIYMGQGKPSGFQPQANIAQFVGHVLV
jgi:hypothetical protein